MSVTLQGQRELERELFALEDALREHLSRQAIEAGAQMLVPPIREAAPRGRTGNLKKSVGYVIRNYEGGVIVAVIGPQVPAGAHGPIVEDGTKRRETSRGFNRGEMPANPFVVPTFERYKSQAELVMASVIASGLQRRAA